MNAILKGLKLMNDAVEGYFKLICFKDDDILAAITHQIQLNKYRKAYKIVEKTTEKMIDDLSTKKA